jgi:hypothetical protein
VIWKGDWQLARGVDLASEDVSDRATCLLPWHKVGDDGLDLVGPWHQDRPGDGHHHDRVKVARSDGLDQRVLFLLRATVVQREAGAVATLVAECAHEDDRNVRLF